MDLNCGHVREIPRCEVRHQMLVVVFWFQVRVIDSIPAKGAAISDADV